MAKANNPIQQKGKIEKSKKTLENQSVMHHKSVSMMLQQTRGHNPLLEKFDSKHIDKVLDYSYEDNKSERLFILLYRIMCVGVGLVVFLLVTYFFIFSDKADKELYLTILTFLGGGLFGGGLGYGLGLTKNRDN